jgi:AraC-like DNA-binding protein
MHTAHIACVKRILSAAEQQGFDPAEVLSRANVDRQAPLFLNADLTDVKREHWIGIEPVFAVWDYAAGAFPRQRLLKDLMTALPAEALGPLGFLMLTAPTLRASLEQLMAHFAVVTTSGVWRRRDVGRKVWLTWSRIGYSPGQCLANEAIFAHTVVILEQVARGRVLPDRICFQHAALPSSAALSKLLPVPISYGERENALIFEREQLEERPPLENRPMALYFERRLGEQLDFVRTRQSLVDALRSELRREPSLTDECLFVASERLGMSSRSLQRKLSRAGTSFSRELEHARQERAYELVSGSGQPIVRIARDLGFTDASAFSRAFRRWFEASPSALRRARPD